MMKMVYVGVGSNIDKEIHIRKGVYALMDRYNDLVISPVYESAPVGFRGKNFYNLVVGFETDEPPEEIERYLHDVETSFGRDRGGEVISRTLDLDLLLYDDLVYNNDGIRLPREDVLRYAFVLKPLADIAGECRHPLNGHCYRELWESFDKQGQEICRVDIEFD